MTPLRVEPIKTAIYRSGDIVEFIVQAVPPAMIEEEMVIAVTSKIVSLAEGRTVEQNSTSKEALVKRESDIFLGEIGYGCFLTVKDGLLIPSAGIDESNSENGSYILYPIDPYKSAHQIWKGLCARWNLSKLGVILTDSHTTPLRRGVTGVALSFWGIEPIRKLVGSTDLFGRTLQMTNMNLVDGIASASVLMMGEGSESTPLAIVTGVGLDFCDSQKSNALSIPIEEDLYGPLLKNYLEPIS